MLPYKRHPTSQTETRHLLMDHLMGTQQDGQLEMSLVQNYCMYKLEGVWGTRVARIENVTHEWMVALPYRLPPHTPLLPHLTSA